MIQTRLRLRAASDEYNFGLRSSGESHGVVHTKAHVVQLILDIAGYTADRDLTKLRLLEPACGLGAFLLPAIERLLAAAKRRRVSLLRLADAITAYDIDPHHVDVTREAIVALLLRHSVKQDVATHLAAQWVKEDDFLLCKKNAEYDVVVGNPPYVRIEQISPNLQIEYRRRFSSLFDRADLYVAFIEHSVSLLSPTGVVSFICADRWTLNKYGAPLRRFVTERCSVAGYIDLHRASPFESDVIAYPSIFLFSRRKSDVVPVVTLETGSAEECAAVPHLISGSADATEAPSGVKVSRYSTWFSGSDPWVVSSPEQLATLRDLEARFGPLEDSARVGIGVATGNDQLFIVPSDIDIEADRLVPLVMRSDITNGAIADGRRCVINAFDDAGGVVDLAKYPRLGRYLNENATAIKARHVAQKNPRAWFRTIDRVYPSLVKQPKLLIPDIAGANEVAFERGQFHPHHNLYFVTSSSWDMQLLGGLLSSRVALFFVWSYALKMRGGYLRFQAQYLRRIRVPAPGAIDVDVARRIREAFAARDFATLDALALDVYGLASLPTFDFVDTRK